jgi:hypothetical protein
VRWWIGEADRHVVGWVVDLEADLRMVGYSGNLKSERWVGKNSVRPPAGGERDCGRDIRSGGRVDWGNENRLAGGKDGKGSESRWVDVKVELGLVQAIGGKGG